MPLTKLPAYFDDLIARGRRAARRKHRKKIGRKLSAAGAKFDDLAVRGCIQNCRDLYAKRRAKQGGHFRRGDEIAARAELARACDVVAEARSIQRDLHVAIERQKTAAFVDRDRNGVAYACAMRTCFAVGFRKRRIDGVQHVPDRDRRFDAGMSVC